MLRTAAAATTSQRISVGIVGAGFAGLRCADVLLQHGCKVTLLEARGRLGGRVAQSEQLGHLVDLGPNWIHGTHNNPVMEIADRTGTKLHTWDESMCIFNSEGKLVSDDDVAEYNALLWDDVIARAFRFSNEQQESIDPESSLYDFFVDKTKELFKSESAVVAARKRREFLQYAWIWSAYIGSPVDRQSLKFFWLEQCIDGENAFVAETYHKILADVARPAERRADIRLNTEVVRIAAPKGSEGVEEEQKVCVTTTDGLTMSFDEVVVTTPLGWLKHNKSAFVPDLPAKLAAAIDNISYGQLDKVYINFPSAFWTVQVPAEANAPSISGINLHDKTSGERAAAVPLQDQDMRFPGFVNWLQPDYSQPTNPERWMQEALDLSALRADCAHPTLLFYISGVQSRHVGELVATAADEADRTSRLQAFFEPYYSLLPNYSASAPECKPRAILATAWAIDRFAGYGSYSNFQVGLEKGDQDIETMRHGMPERHIWFAGEHTAPFKALGTSTGAYLSGEAVGKRIAEAHRLHPTAAVSSGSE